MAMASSLNGTTWRGSLVTLGWNGPQLLAQIEFSPARVAHVATSLTGERQQLDQWAEWIVQRIGSLPHRTQLVVRQRALALVLLAGKPVGLQGCYRARLQFITVLRLRPAEEPL